MEAITLTYIDNTSGLVYSRAFSALRVKGFDPVDDTEDFPDILHKIIDGSILHQTIGLRRHITVELGVVSNPIARKFAGDFFRSTQKYLTFTHDGIPEIAPVTNDTSILQTSWIDNTVISRYIVLHLQDADILTDFPSNVNLAVPETDMYIKKRVLIIGTKDSPESFSTGSGKLATCDAPAGAYPYFNDSLQKYDIDVSRVYQDCFFFVPSIESTSGGVLTFTIARSDAGDAYSGIDFYADIIIKAVDIV